MEFEVPQFIEIEDKPFVFFTFKQFIFLVGGGGLGFIIWRLLYETIGGIPALIPAIPVAVFIGILGFKIVHPKEAFIETVEHAIRFLIKKRVFIWRKKYTPAEKGVRESDSLGEIDFSTSSPNLSGSRLKDMSWGLDTKEQQQGSTQIPR